MPALGMIQMGKRAKLELTKVFYVICTKIVLRNRTNLAETVRDKN